MYDTFICFYQKKALLAARAPKPEKEQPVNTPAKRGSLLVHKKTYLKKIEVSVKHKQKNQILGAHFYHNSQFFTCKIPPMATQYFNVYIFLILLIFWGLEIIFY